jgi:hypothetical protein
MLRDSDEEKTFVLEMLGLDKSSDEDCDLVVNKVSDQYSASPPSFAQLDSGATKSISPRPDLFSYILLTPDTRIRVANGRELGGVIGEGPLGTNTGLLDFGLWSVYFEVTLASTGPRKLFR